MKRIFSLISSVVIGGLALFANQPTEYSFGITQQRQSHHLVLTPFDNPTLNNCPQLKQRMEQAWTNSGFFWEEASTSNQLKASCSPFSNQINKSSLLGSTPLKSKRSNSLKEKTKDSASRYGVDCEVVYDKSIYNPGIITFYNEELDEQFFFDYDPETWTKLPYLIAELPEGEYTVYAQFWFAYLKDGSKAKDGAFALVFKENVKVPCDEKLIFDASDAINQLKFNTVLPNGEHPTLDLVSGKTGEIIKPGNVKMFGSNTFIVDKEVGPIVSYFSVTNYALEESERISKFDIYVNNLSDRFCAYRHCLIAEETAVLASQYIGDLNGEHTTTTINFADDYTKIHTEISHSPAYNDLGLAQNGFYVNTYFAWQNINEGSIIGQFNTDCDYIYFSQDAQCNPEALLPLISVQPYDATFTLESEDKNGDPILEEINYNISALPFCIIDDRIQYVNNNHSACGNYAFQIPESGPICDYPGQPRYTFWANQQTSLIGNNAPINSVLNEPTPWDGDANLMNFIDPAYIGRWGEVRIVDIPLMSTQLDYNGETVFDSSNTEVGLEQWGAEWGFEDHPLGVFDYYFDNKNIAVDGIPGRNYTHIYADWRKEDKNAPVIQMLMFRNGLDEITDRFDNAADGIIEFSGGDFNWHYIQNPYKAYFSCEPMVVKVEYSPYIQDTWSEINVIELPEYYFMPGFGYFYRGSLACVDKMSENGWYDLKFTFTDLSGNYMEQTVSPAFKINSLTGKAQISTQGVQVYANNGMINISAESVSNVEVYSMDGRRVYHGNGKSIPMSKGAYVVKVRNGGTESVHKVII